MKKKLFLVFFGLIIASHFTFGQVYYSKNADFKFRLTTASGSRMFTSDGVSLHLDVSNGNINFYFKNATIKGASATDTVLMLTPLIGDVNGGITNFFGTVLGGIGFAEGDPHEVELLAAGNLKTDEHTLSVRLPITITPTAQGYAYTIDAPIIEANGLRLDLISENGYLVKRREN